MVLDAWKEQEWHRKGGLFHRSDHRGGHLWDRRPRSPSRPWTRPRPTSPGWSAESPPHRMTRTTTRCSEPNPLSPRRHPNQSVRRDRAADGGRSRTQAPNPSPRRNPRNRLSHPRTWLPSLRGNRRPPVMTGGVRRTDRSFNRRRPRRPGRPWEATAATGGTCPTMRRNPRRRPSRPSMRRIMRSKPTKHRRKHLNRPSMRRTVRSKPPSIRPPGPMRMACTRRRSPIRGSPQPTRRGMPHEATSGALRRRPMTKRVGAGTKMKTAVGMTTRRRNPSRGPGADCSDGARPSPTTRTPTNPRRRIGTTRVRTMTGTTRTTRKRDLRNRPNGADF